LQRAEEQHSYGRKPMQSTRKNEADGDDQENRNDTRYDFHWPLTPFPKSQLPFGYFAARFKRGSRPLNDQWQ